MTHNWLLTLANERWYSSLLNLHTGDTDMHEFFYNELKGFASSAIDLGGYDYTQQELYIRFNGGSEVVYFNVPYKVWENLLDASSAGGFYNSDIVGKFSSRTGPVTLDKAPDGGPVPENAPEEVLVAAAPAWANDSDFKGETHFGSAVEGANRVLGSLTDAVGEQVKEIHTVLNRYGVKYEFGDGFQGYYEAHAYSDHTALLNFFGAIEEAEALIPGIVVNVKVKELVRYFE